MKETIDKLRGSRLTVVLLLWLVFILFNTFVGRQIQGFLLSSGGKQLILASISVVAVCALLLLARELVKVQLSLRLKPLIVLLLAALLAAMMMPIAEETLHIVKYGGLGFLAQTLVHKQGVSNRLAFAFVIAISIFDEVIQHFLPYRVGDLRDVGLNVASGLWGASIIHLCAKREDHHKNAYPE
ncbi:MAG: VanZ family protein [Oceanipulchritudo sp.]